MLSTVVDLLRCPRCAGRFTIVDRSLHCREGHVFDIARQGYANLTGAAQPAHADSAAMVAARSRLLGSGRYAAITDALLDATPTEMTDLLDVGTGTGHYAAALLDARRRSRARALGVDVSVAACRHAARAHQRLGVVTADAWQPLPVTDRAVDLVLSVFSPRNAAEFARVLRPDGSVITVTPGPDHLSELREPFGLLGLESGKEDRMAQAFAGAGLTMIDRRDLLQRAPWSLDDAVDSVLMGPNAFHRDADRVLSRAAELDWPRSVTTSCVIARWQGGRPGFSDR